jgi:hypothetical protein
MYTAKENIQLVMFELSLSFTDCVGMVSQIKSLIIVFRIFPFFTM